MEHWCMVVTNMKDDEPHKSKDIKKICEHTFRYFCKTKFKYPKKFEEKHGHEYEAFKESLSEFPQDLVEDVLNYPEFLEKTHEVSKKYKSKMNLSKD